MAVVTQPEPTGAFEPPLLAHAACEASIELYWLPLGAGGWFVRLNGRIYEAIHALLEHRRPLDLYHSALQVRLPEGRFVIENCWPIPDADPAARGVIVQGPVGSRRLARFRVFRYEVRRWRDGVIADADEAVASPQSLSDDPLLASPARPGWRPAEPDLGPRRARDGRDVELELSDLVAAGPQRPRNRRDQSPGRWPRARMAGGPGDRPPLAKPGNAPPSALTAELVSQCRRAAFALANKASGRRALTSPWSRADALARSMLQQSRERAQGRVAAKVPFVAGRSTLVQRRWRTRLR
jgi:hypothetical protein